MSDIDPALEAKLRELCDSVWVDGPPTSIELCRAAARLGLAAGEERQKHIRRWGGECCVNAAAAGAAQERARLSNCFVCPGCEDRVAADEDACCVTCGMDCIVLYERPMPAAAHADPAAGEGES